MARAIWKDTVIAQSDSFEEVEGNLYFPPESVDAEYLQPSNTRTTCSLRGWYLNEIVKRLGSFLGAPPSWRHYGRHDAGAPRAKLRFTRYTVETEVPGGDGFINRTDLQ